MQRFIEIGEKSTDGSFRLVWEDGYEIHSAIQGDEIIIKANRQGLRTLASHLMALAEEDVSSGYHIHLDDLNSLEDGSYGIVLERI